MIRDISRLVFRAYSSSSRVLLDEYVKYFRPIRLPLRPYSHENLQDYCLYQVFSSVRGASAEGAARETRALREAQCGPLLWIQNGSLATCRRLVAQRSGNLLAQTQTTTVRYISRIVSKRWIASLAGHANLSSKPVGGGVQR